MFHVQLRRYLPDGVTAAEVLDVQEIQFSKAGSASAALTLKVSLAMGEGIRGWIEQHPGQAFIIGVEYSVDGGGWVAPRDNLYVAYKGSADDVDPAETQQITCIDWVSWQLARTQLEQSASSKDGARIWTEAGGPASAGYIMYGMLTESKNRGWAPQLVRGFTTAVDAAGAAWTAAERISQPWKHNTPLSQVLQQLTEGGLCDWWSEGTTLRLFRPGVGEDHTEVTLGGAGFSRAPGAWDFSGVFTHLTVVPEKGKWLSLPNAGADASFGRLEASMTQSDVSDAATATKLAQPVLIGGRSAKREQSYEWTVADKMPVPWRDFNVHDLVTIDTAFGTREERIVELVVRVRDDVVTCVAVTGDKMLSAVVRRDRRAQAAVIGNIIGGSGNGLPGAGGAPLASPIAPTGVHVVSNVGSWRSDGTAQSTVTIAWDAVTQTEDGSAVDVRGYEIVHRTSTSEPTISSTTGVAFTATDWEPGVARFVKVRALPQVGNASAWSAEIVVTPQVPGVIVPRAPTGLTVTSNTAAFQADGTAVATVTVGWTAVTESLDSTPISVQEYEVRIGLDAQRVTGTTATFTVPSSRQVSVTVRVRTTLDIWGDPSTALSVTGAAPAVSTTAPSAPIVTAGMGGVGYRWDGLSSTGAAMPAGTGRVVAESSAAAAGPWAAQGATLSAAGGGSLSAAPGASVFVRLRAFDTLGRLTGTSTVASSTAQGVSLDDIDPDLSGEIDAIRYTADGKNRIYVSATEPDRDRGRNYFSDPAFANSTGYAPWTVVAGGIEKAGTGAQQGVYVATSEIPVVPGEKYQARATRTDLSGSTGSASIYAQRKTGAGVWVYWTSAVALLAAGSVVGPWQTVPADTTAVRFGFYTEANMPAATKVRITGVAVEQARGGDQWWVLDPTGTSIVGVKVWNGTAWVNYQIIAQDIIAAGTIKGLHVDANTLSVNHVEPSFGADLDISASESVTIIVGRQNEQADQIAGVTEGVTGAQATADAATSAAGTAQATANGAASTAAGAASSAAAVGQRLDRHQTYYRFGASGLAIGDPNLPSELRLKPDRIEMTQNNVVVSYWEGGVFVADEARLKSAQIANHQFMAYGPGRTIVRPL